VARDRDRDAATYRRRQQLARERGYPSLHAQVRAGGTGATSVRSRRDLEGLPAGAQQARRQALGALADIRGGTSIEHAASRNNTTPQAVRYWVGDQLDRPTDRAYRPMVAYTEGQPVEIDVRGSRAASTVGEYHAALKGWLATGDDTLLAPFRGVRVGGVVLETDPEMLRQLAAAGLLAIEDIYSTVGAS
jgi:hypothetical protein